MALGALHGNARTRILKAAYIAAAVALTATDAGAQATCPAAPVDVTAATDDERRVACSAAGEALRLLGRCHVYPRRPLDIRIMTEVRHPLGGAIFGMFDTKRDRVLVTRSTNIPPLTRETPYDQLPPHEFYRSLIVHEVVHGVLHQNYERQPTSHAAYEYPAYALQIESLTPAVRDGFLKATRKGALRNDFVFTDNILLFDPFFFAARAYEHFKSAGGCAHLRALIEGKAGLGASMTP
jgi:hypothetical protein